MWDTGRFDVDYLEGIHSIVVSSQVDKGLKKHALCGVCGAVQLSLGLNGE